MTPPEDENLKCDYCKQPIVDSQWVELSIEQYGLPGLDEYVGFHPLCYQRSGIPEILDLMFDR